MRQPNYMVVTSMMKGTDILIRTYGCSFLNVLYTHYIYIYTIELYRYNQSSETLCRNGMNFGMVVLSLKRASERPNGSLITEID